MDAKGRPLESPDDRRADLRWRFDGFLGFLHAFAWGTRLLRTPDAYCDLLRDLMADLDRQGVVYAEVFVAFGQMNRAGVDPASVLPELAAVAADHGGVDVRFLADVTRQWGVAEAEKALDQALELQEHRIVGFGMGGDESALRARDFARVYRRAEAAGLGLTCHAGEGTTADAVREAVEELRVTRIGHGIAAATDPDLMRELREEGITLEVCPTSNRCTGAWDPAGGPHPVLTLAEHGVPMVLGSDDPAFFDCDLAGEFQLVEEWGVDPEPLRERAAEASFRS